MGSDPYLAKPEHGAGLLETAVTALREDLETFLSAA
jgi:creatinine amidohydrolase